jgi:hypothetical protein
MAQWQKRTLSALGLAGFVVLCGSTVTTWLILLMFPIAYGVVVVRNWHKP